ncbi:uncharacterized protein LOC134396587 [Elgaria multicarinata webbii]|uniref:uncharacterized protein LOC134396587 n=1 Tax=Elgaria multicarinata webbii TaxID=159646 RepID=UPI002FCCC115
MDVRERLLWALQELAQDEFDAFVFFLDSIPRGKLHNVTRVTLAELLLRYFPDRALAVTAEVLEKIPRMDLLQQLRREAEGAGGIRERRGGGGGDAPREEAAAVARAPPAAPVQPRVVSDKELMKLSKNMGREWKIIGIEFLGMKNSLLEQIEEDNPKNMAMQAFYMLKNWRNREKGGATAVRLYDILSQEAVELGHDAYAFLIENS